MEINYIEKAYAEMLGRLESVNGSIRESVGQLDESLSCVAATVHELKRQVKENPFRAEQDEIRFFKYTKPRFYCWYIYLVHLYHILRAVPVGTDEMIRDYYTDEIGVINRFFQQHPEHYQYYLNDNTVSDDQFFLCRNRPEFPPAQELLQEHKWFSTHLDYLFATFRAYEMLRDFVIRRIRLLYRQSDSTFMSEMMIAKKRWWSGDKVELIEIAYGIYYTHRINGGRAEIADIIEWLEESLNVDLAQAYRMFLDIRRRKTFSYTKFLDEMREAIHRHIDETNSYKKSKKQEPPYRN